MCVCICFHPIKTTRPVYGAWPPQRFGGGAHTLALSKHSLVVWAYRRTQIVNTQMQGQLDFVYLVFRGRLQIHKIIVL